MSTSSAQAIPAHVPPECVVDFDYLHPPGAEQEVHLTWRNALQFGPEFGLQETDDGVRLFDGPDQVEVFNESTAPLVREVARGQDEPLLGYVWEDFRDREPRWVETTTAHGADVDNVTTLSFDPEKTFRASAAAPLGDTNTFTLSEDGEAAKTLVVTRAGDQLTIEEAKLPTP